jgi:hypothetical protein
LNLCLNHICEGGERLPSNVPVSQPKGCGTGFSVLVSQPEGCLQSRGTTCSSNLCSNLIFELRQLRVHVARVQVEKEEAERERDAVLEQRDKQRQARRAQEDDMLWLKAQQAASSLRPTNSTFEMEKEVLQLRRDKVETEEQVLFL